MASHKNCENSKKKFKISFICQEKSWMYGEKNKSFFLRFEIVYFLLQPNETPNQDLTK